MEVFRSFSVADPRFLLDKIFQAHPAASVLLQPWAYPAWWAGVDLFQDLLNRCRTWRTNIEKKNTFGKTARQWKTYEDLIYRNLWNLIFTSVSTY